MTFDPYIDLLERLEKERSFCERSAADFADSERYEEAARSKVLANGIWWLLYRHQAACKEAAKAASADTYATRLVKADVEREGA